MNRGETDLALTLILTLAAGISIGFTLGRVFERWEYQRRGYKVKKRKRRWGRDTTATDRKE